MNVLWCTVDCLRYDALSMNGNPRSVTDSLDSVLEQDFVSFADACTQSSFTLTVISSLLTGTYPATHGTLRWDDYLSEELFALGDVDDNIGEVTAIPAMNFIDGDWGLERCFDQVANLDEQKATRECSQAAADEVCSATRDIISSQRPFTAFLWFFDLHTPYLSDVVYSGTNESRDSYDTELSFVADELEGLFDYLKAEGVYDETMIILTGDHGEIFTEHHRLSWTTVRDVGKHVPGLRRLITGDGCLGHLGRPPVEELVHVPLYVKLPDQKGGGTTVDGQVELIDILPTVLDEADVDIPDSIQGESLLPLVEGLGTGKEYVRSELIANPANGRFRMVRSDTHKLIRHTKPHAAEFRQDPLTFVPRRFLTPATVLLERADESENVIKNYPNVADQLHRELQDWPSELPVESRRQLSSDKREELENLGYL